MTVDRRKVSAVPASRLARLSRIARLATAIAGGMLAEGGRQIARGNFPRARELLLTPANARRVAEQLANLRGAAMKVGQLLSMDAGDLLPPQLAEILGQLRMDGQIMPRRQVSEVLNRAWGNDWERQFSEFAWRPVAAASIGQVHRAVTRDGCELALKIQYPGVARSIDSDVDNVATLLRISRLLPESLDVEPLLHEAKRQLRAEADYLKEADYLRRYAEALANSADYVMPSVDMALTRRDVLAMSFLHGRPVETLDGASPATRDRIAHLLFRLLFREMFEFRLVQTDPNFANYRYQETEERLVLLDFGATRKYSRRVISGYRKLFRGGISGDRTLVLAGALEIGYTVDTHKRSHQEALTDLFLLALEPLAHEGPFDFAASDLPTRVRDAGVALSVKTGYWHSPPADAVFLHRKLGGLYLLGARLGARVDLRTLVEDHL